jgi:hypothetical protein
VTLGQAGFTDPKPAEADHPEKADKAVAEAFSPTLALGGEDIICPRGFTRLGAAARVRRRNLRVELAGDVAEDRA